MHRRGFIGSLVALAAGLVMPFKLLADTFKPVTRSFGGLLTDDQWSMRYWQPVTRHGNYLTAGPLSCEIFFEKKPIFEHHSDSWQGDEITKTFTAAFQTAFGPEPGRTEGQRLLANLLADFLAKPENVRYVPSHREWMRMIGGIGGVAGSDLGRRLHRTFFEVALLAKPWDWVTTLRGEDRLVWK